MNTFVIFAIPFVLTTAIICACVAIMNAKEKETKKRLAEERKSLEAIPDTTNHRDLFRKYADSDFIGYSVELFKDKDGVTRRKSVPFEIFLTKKRFIERKKVYRMDDKDGFYSGMRLLYVTVKDIEDSDSPRNAWSYRQVYENRSGDMLTELGGNLIHI